MPDADPRETRGNKNHRADCQCPPCVQQRDYRRKLEQEAALVAGYREQHAASCAAVAAIAARLTGLPAPDALAALIGPDAALSVCAGAGLSPERVRDRWSAARPVERPVAASAGVFAADPDHDPRVVEMMSRPGASWAEISAVRATVAAEYQQRAADKADREDAYYGRDKMPVAMGVTTDELGRPVQRSAIHHTVPELGVER